MKHALFVSSFSCALALASSSALAQPSPAPDAPLDVADPSAPDETAPRPRFKRGPAPAALQPDDVAAVPPAPAPSQAERPSASPDTTEPQGGPRYDLIRVNVGLRIGYLPSRGFDTFSSNDVLPQFSVDGTYPLLTAGRLVLGAGVGWDVGSRSDSVRGLSSSLTTHHLYVPIEGRWHLSSGLSAFVKVAPGASAAIASVRDSATSNELSTTGWAFSADASVGASILMGPRARMDKRTPRFWLTPEVGYSFTTNAPLRAGIGRDEKDLLGSDESANLRALALSGFFWRASVGMTF